MEKTDKVKELKELGNKEFKQENYKKAIKYYNDALLLESTDKTKSILFSNRSLCFINLIEILGSKKKILLKKALSDAKQCTELNKFWYQGYARLGEIYELKGELEIAIEQYNIAISLDNRQQILFQERSRLKECYEFNNKWIQLNSIKNHLNSEKTFENYTKTLEIIRLESIQNLDFFPLFYLCREILYDEEDKRFVGIAIDMLRFSATNSGPTFRYSKESAYLLGTYFQNATLLKKSLKWYEIGYNLGCKNSAIALTNQYNEKKDLTDEQLKYIERLLLFCVCDNEIVNVECKIIDLYIKWKIPETAKNWLDRYSNRLQPSAEKDQEVSLWEDKINEMMKYLEDFNILEYEKKHNLSHEDLNIYMRLKRANGIVEQASRDIIKEVKSPRRNQIFSFQTKEIRISLSS